MFIHISDLSLSQLNGFKVDLAKLMSYLMRGYKILFNLFFVIIIIICFTSISIKIEINLKI